MQWADRLECSQYYKKTTINAKMINVLQLCLSRGYGGLELYVDKTVKLLNKQQFNVHILVRKETFLYDRFVQSEIPVRSLDTCLRYLPIIAAVRLARYIDRHDISILHMHWGHDLFLAVLAKLFSHRKPKLIYTRQMTLTKAKKDVYHRFLYRHVDSYIPITQELADQARRYLPIDPQRVSLIYSGVPKPAPGEIDCSLLVESGLSADAFKVAIFGRIEEGKGQHLVVEAVSRIKQAGYPIQAAMIGHVMDAHYFANLKQRIADMFMQADIKYLGFHPTPVSIMSCFDVVVLATKCETFGLVLPEAMRSGVAVIGSNCGGVPEIITHQKTGLLFKTQDVDDLTVQLTRLVENRGFCQELAHAGQQEADTRFTEERHYQQLEALYICHHDT